MEAFEAAAKTLAESSSVDEQLKGQLDVKTLKGKNRRENGSGIGVSVNRKEGKVGDLCVGGVGEVVPNRVAASGGVMGKDFGDRNVVVLDDDDDDDDNDDDDGLEDSEMNGVSSLLKMQESGGLRGLDSVLDVINENEKKGFQNGDDGVCPVVDPNEQKSVRPEAFDVNEEDLGREIGENDQGKDSEGEEDSEGEGHEFNVGDFVWGKIRSHPWWPGRIYHHSDASDFANKVRQGDRILVAYFGDGTFAWCNPSQLKPFHQNFVEMSKQSSSKNFISAVEKAVEEVGRSVDLKMTCSCVPKENLIGFGRSLAVNAGIREGLLVPESGIEKFPSTLFEPAELVAALKGTAQEATISNMLQFMILKSFLSAFYHARGGYQLPIYYEPQQILGLQDDTTNSVPNMYNYNDGVDVKIWGPVEDWLSSPRAPKFGQSTESLLQKCKGFTEDRQYQRRKQKSIAEIIGVHSDADGQNKEDKENYVALIETKKRKDRGETMGGDAEGDNEAHNVTKEGSNLGKFGRKKRKFGDEADGEDKNKVGNLAKSGRNLGKPASSSEGKKSKDSNDVNINGDSNSSLGGGGIDEESGKTPKTRERKKKVSCSVENGDGKGEKEETRNDMMDETKETEKSSSLRERKKSKYLSPPYTNLSIAQRKKEIEAEYIRISREGLAKAASHLGGSSSILKDDDQDKFAEEPGATNETSGNSGLQTAQEDQNHIIDPTKVKVPAGEVLSHIRCTALNQMYLKDSCALDMVEGFMSVFRSSVYFNGSNYKMYHKQKPGKRRKSEKSVSDPLVRQKNQTDHSSAEKSRPTKIRKKGEAKSKKPAVKQSTSVQDTKINDMQPNEKERDSTPALFVSFGPGSSLPTRDDLFNIYEKFGTLNKDETEMFYSNYCARIVFLKSSEAEEAFKSCQLDSPFGSDSVTFRLRYISAETKAREIRDISRPKPTLPKEGVNTPVKPSSSQSSAADASQLHYIKQKLQMMTNMLESSDGKMSLDMKSKLEGEMKGLLEKVSTMVGSSS